MTTDQRIKKQYDSLRAQHTTELRNVAEAMIREADLLASTDFHPQHGWISMLRKLHEGAAGLDALKPFYPASAD